jgi:thymidylate kinase
MLAPQADHLQQHNETAGAILQRVIATFESAGIRTCILHGYQGLPTDVPSDVDCVVSANTDEAIDLLYRHHKSIGARIVRRDGAYVVLAGYGKNSLPTFLCLDLMRDCQVDDLVLYSGDEILASRRPFGAFWVPAASVAFAAYLARSVYKRRLDQMRLQQIENFYKEEPEAAQEELTHFWMPATSKRLAEAASRAEWARIRPDVGSLRQELISHCLRRAPLSLLLGRLRGAIRRVSRLIRPTGVTVVLLGPDGAGKSSTIENLGSALKDAFVRQEVRGFAPALSRLWDRKPRNTSEPHGLPPRSFLLSLLRAGYWLGYNLWSHASLHLARARSTLVLYDRHFSDILIDPRRYRYGGPHWALRLNTWLMPEPGLVLLLDAPAETLQSRKREVPFAETKRQLALYRKFVGSLSNGHVIDADGPPDQVAAQAAAIILNRQFERYRPKAQSLFL